MKSSEMREVLWSGRWPGPLEFAVALAAVLVARGSMIFPLVYAVDDYGVGGINGMYAHFVSQMRWPTFWLLWAVEKLGGGAPFLGVFWPVVVSGALVFFGLCLRRLLIPDAPSAPALVAVLIFALFPFHSDTLTFRHIAPAFALYLMLTGVALLLLQKKGWSFAVGVLALFAACAYPVLLAYVVVPTLLLALSRWATSGSFAAAYRPAVLRIGLLAVVLVVYIVASKGYLALSGVVPEGRVGALSEWADPVAKIRLLGAQVLSLVAGRGDGLPMALEALQNLTAIAAVVSLAFYGRGRQAGFAHVFMRAGVAVLVLAAALAAAVFAAGAFDQVAGTWNMRTLSSLGVFWSGVFALAWLYSLGAWRKAVVAVGLVLAAGYAFYCNQQSADFARLNMRDHLLASRMVERLGQQPGYEGIRTVVVVGGYNPAINTSSLRTSSGVLGFNVSALAWDWSKTPLLREASGSRWSAPTREDKAAAAKSARQAPSWPAEGSVFITSDIGVVVLDNAAD